MKNAKLLMMCVVSAVAVTSNALYAQIINTRTDGMTDGQIMQNIYMDNARRATVPGSYPSGGSRANPEAVRYSKIGEARIKAGKASTQFVSSLTGTQAIAQSVSWDKDEPQDLAGQVKFIQRYVNMFEKLMTQNGYTPKDFSDGYAFAKALSYAAYHNKDLSKAEVVKMRDENRENLLKAAVFQGLPDAVKQYHYELNATMAMQAAEQRVKARQATNEAERQRYEANAKEYANHLLKY